LFEHGFNKIVIKAMVENIGSNRVIEKCGFTYIGEQVICPRSCFKPDSVTVKCYILEKDTNN
jgi:ribosomal-protein-alanine N-acetyltransferase